MCASSCSSLAVQVAHLVQVYPPAPRQGVVFFQTSPGHRPAQIPQDKKQTQEIVCKSKIDCDAWDIS